MKRLTLVTVISLFCTQVIGMAITNNNESKESIEALEQEIDASFLDGFSLKALVADRQKVTWNDYKRINQALNLLLMYEQSLCALEQLPPLLRLAEKSQRQRLVNNKRFDLCGFTANVTRKENKVARDANIFLIKTSEGRAAYFQLIQYLKKGNSRYIEINLEDVIEFIPWLQSSHPEIRNIAGISIHSSCADRLQLIIGNEFPGIIMRVALLKNKNEDYQFALKQAIAKRCENDISASLEKIPEFYTICDLVTQVNLFAAKSLESMIWISEDNTLASDIDTVVARCARIRPIIAQRYCELYRVLEKSLQNCNLATKNNYFSKIADFFFNEKTVTPLPSSLDSLKKEIKQFDFTQAITKEDIISQVLPLASNSNVKKAASKIARRKRYKKLQKNKAKEVQEELSDQESQEEDTQDLDVSKELELSNSNNTVSQIKEEKDELSISSAVPSIKYAQRIEQYFVPNREIDLYHGFTRLVDVFLFKYGTQEKRENKTYQFIDTVYKLAGEIQYKDGKKEYVVLHATKGYEDVCYHRGYESRSADVFDNYLADTFWKLAHQEEQDSQSSKSEIILPELIHNEGKIVLENKWLVKIEDYRLKATIILYKPYCK